VFDRVEDAPNGLHVEVSGGKVAVDGDMSSNPSLRRDGLSIRFACESCDAQPVLTIRQHKGATFVDLTLNS
jgi:hypothetical protein